MEETWGSVHNQRVNRVANCAETKNLKSLYQWDFQPKPIWFKKYNNKWYKEQLCNIEIKYDNILQFPVKHKSEQNGGAKSP